MSVERPQSIGNDLQNAWKNQLTPERQEYWKKTLQMGEYSPYSDIKPIKWDAFRDASYEWLTNPRSFLKHFGDHIRKIDYEFRGEKDIGGAKERTERAIALSGMIALFTAFDYATSKPFEKIIPMKKNAVHPDDIRHNANWGAVKKLIEVLNDKYASALGNLVAERLSGKRGFIHEVADKGADTLQVGYDKTNDLVNGATLESYIRLVFQVPIAGALFEQGVSRIARWQEQSSIHTATGKMIYMALGVFIRDQRRAGRVEADFAKKQAENFETLIRSVT